MRSHQLGQQGELFALQYLREQGYVVLATNYRTKIGEIDVIARDQGTIVFIEVKTREQDGWNAFEAVHPAKQEKLFRVAEEYLVKTFGRVDVRARFDVLGVVHLRDGTFRGELLKDAFSK